MSRFPCGQWTPFPLNECTIPPSLMWGEGREIDTFGNTEVMENVTCRLCFSVLSRVMAFASIVVVNARKWRPERKIPAGCFKSVVPLNTGVLVVKNILNAQLFQTELDHLRRLKSVVNRSSIASWVQAIFCLITHGYFADSKHSILLIVLMWFQTQKQKAWKEEGYLHQRP